ncbi:MAG TPA: hypothetical protein O0X97_00780 [Methanocorpusculum sp.]|nr:hypothetical protein [Methanocorpusculum sp.]
MSYYILHFMDNRVLFRDGPLRITCSGCGKEFYAEEISRCRLCGGYFCRDCQKTHDCRTDSSEAHNVSSSLLPTTVPTNAVESDEISSHPDSADSVPAAAETSALLQDVQSEKVPYKNTGMMLTDDEAYIAYVREINPFVTCESCGEQYPQSDIWICPDCGAVLCQICRQKHKCPKPEGQQNRLLAYLPFTKEKKPAASKTAVRSSVPEAAVSAVASSAVTQAQSVASQNLPVETSAVKSVPTGVKMLACDHCGKEYPVTKLKKCQSCGAVLCPKCRLLHSCSSKTDSSDEKKTAKPAVSKKKDSADPKKKEKAQKTEAAKKTAADSAKVKPDSLKKTAVPKKDWDELIICDECGQPYLKSKMRKCHTCGAVLCPKCRRKHTCDEKKG